ncbi:hypothetical protein BD770DRAFT_91110, partial [Pilaira anomala]
GEETRQKKKVYIKRFKTVSHHFFYSFTLSSYLKINMKFSSILFVTACLVLAVSAAPCDHPKHAKHPKHPSHHPKNKGKKYDEGPNKHYNYNEEYNINKEYHYIDKSNSNNKSIVQTNGDTGTTSGKGLGVNLGGVGSKTENTNTVSQNANIS